MAIDLIGNLKMSLQKKVGEEWQNVQIIVNQQIIIPMQGLVKLDTGEDNLGLEVFEGWNNLKVNVFGAGDYRVYARFEVGEESVEASWKFEVI